MFNGIVGMCAGCLECEDHKLLQPVVNCSLIKEGDWSGFLSVKVLDQYYICIATGSCGIPEYHHISEEEYRTFEIWKNEDKKFYEILNRKSV
jgi:hypothetical protein